MSDFQSSERPPADRGPEPSSHGTELPAAINPLAPLPPSPVIPAEYTNGFAPLTPTQRSAGEGVGQIFITAILVVLAFTAGWLGNSAVNGGTQTPASAQKYAPLIWQAWSTIDGNYVNQSAIDHQKMTYAMISAMVDSLGDTGHSRFLTPTDVKNLNQQLSNSSFVGIGIYLQPITNSQGQTANIIEATIPGSPAAGSGLLPGDQIVGVDTTDVRTKSVNDLSPLIRGPVGSEVTIVVQRGTRTLSFTMKRAAVTAPLAPSYYFAQDHIGYLQITGFDTGTADQVTQALKTLQADGATSLILDMRGNPGGLVDEAIATASDFLPANTTVVYEKDRSGTLTPDKTNSTGLHLTVPMVILVDNGTASAAEIVSLAINEQRTNVPLIGTQTFGTDTVLVPFDLPDGSQILLGIREFLSPDKQQLQPGHGIVPTRTVNLPNGAFAADPLVLQELNLTENDILNCKGLTIDTQLQVAIATLEPTRVATCATATGPTATPGTTTVTPGAGSPTPGAATATPGLQPTPTPSLVTPTPTTKP